MSRTNGGNGADGAPVGFEFDARNETAVAEIISKYPAGRQASAIIALLDLAQRQNGGWLPRAAIEHVAERLGMALIRAYEVASFYTMFNLAPVGRNLVQLCTTTPCWLCGSDEVLAACREQLGIDFGETTEDGAFTLVEVECLGACVNAPMMQVGDDFYEDLDGASTKAILEALARGERPKTGSQSGRQTSAPAGGQTTLTATKSVGGG